MPFNKIVSSIRYLIERQVKHIQSSSKKSENKTTTGVVVVNITKPPSSSPTPSAQASTIPTVPAQISTLNTLKNHQEKPSGENVTNVTNGVVDKVNSGDRLVKEEVEIEVEEAKTSSSLANLKINESLKETSGGVVVMILPPNNDTTTTQLLLDNSSINDLPVNNTSIDNHQLADDKISVS